MSKIEYFEGRRHAARIVEEACAFPDVFYGRGGVATVIDNLRASLAGRPADFARGVQSIIDAVKSIGGAST